MASALTVPLASLLVLGLGAPVARALPSAEPEDQGAAETDGSANLDELRALLLSGTWALRMVAPRQGDGRVITVRFREDGSIESFEEEGEGPTDWRLQQEGEEVVLWLGWGDGMMFPSLLDGEPGEEMSFPLASGRLLEAAAREFQGRVPDGPDLGEFLAMFEGVRFELSRQP